jgi:hypothetical protein
LLQKFESNSSQNEAAHENCAASTSTGSTEFFAEIPLHRDMMLRKSENGRGNSNNFDIHKSAVAECLENMNTAKKVKNLNFLLSKKPEVFIIQKPEVFIIQKTLSFYYPKNLEFLLSKKS